MSEEATEAQALREARAQRADLWRQLVALERALATPVPGRIDAWSAQVHEALVDLAAAFERHIATAEGAHGLFADIRDVAPRLDGELTRLTHEHGEIRDELGDALEAIRATEGAGDPDATLTVREQVTALLVKLSRHRQRGADLVYEAYAVDIGVGD